MDMSQEINYDISRNCDTRIKLNLEFEINTHLVANRI